MIHGSVRTLWCCAAVLAGSAGTVRAQQPAPPPVRSLGPITHVAAESLASVSAAVPVAGGRVYVNDIAARRLVLFDSTLRHVTVVADTSGSREAYGASPGTLLPYRGDSALFVSPSTLSMLVLTPEGTVARVMAAPPSGRGIGLMGLIGNIFGTPGFDARGRLAYYQPVTLMMQGSPSSGPMNLQPPDSAFVVRFDFASRTLDSVAAVRIPRSRTVLSRDDSGRPTGVTVTALPPATVDDWTVTSDGAIAVVRGRDYHVDWLAPDGAWTSTPRMAFAWERLDDTQKTALLDSTAAALQVQMDSNAARQQRAMASGASSVAAVGGGGGVAGQASGSAVIVMRGEMAAPGGGGGGGPVTRSISMPRATVVKAELSEVPDYRPPFSQGAVRADADGRLWVRTTARANGQPVYDLVSRQGVIVDRVQLPAFRAIAGFGPGVVYLGVRDSVGTVHLERARIR
jgi:hypothetical protein